MEMEELNDLTDNSGEEDYNFQSALDFLHIGQTQKALEYILPIAQAPESSSKSLWLTAHILTLMWEIERSIPFLEKAIEQSPSATSIYIDLAGAYEGVGRINDALSILYRCIEQTGDIRARASAAWIELRFLHNEQPAVDLIAECRQNGKCDYFPNIQAYLNILNKNWSEAYFHTVKMLQIPIIEKTRKTTKPIEEPIFTSYTKPTHPYSFTIATSLSPRGGIEQEKAMKTWANTAQHIISVNSAEEIKELQPTYPYIDFIEAKENGISIIGKPLIFIDEILEALETCTTDLCAIINGDILLLNSEDLFKEISTLGSDGLTLCHRVDIPFFEADEGRIYRSGFDAFFFHKSYISHFKGSEMMLGAPWWDYYLPILAQQISLPIHIPSTPLIAHVEHPQNWSKQTHLVTAQLWIHGILEKETDQLKSTRPYKEFMSPLCHSLGHIFGKGKKAALNAKLDDGELLDTISNLAIISALYIRTQAINLNDMTTNEHA